VLGVGRARASGLGPRWGSDVLARGGSGRGGAGWRGGAWRGGGCWRGGAWRGGAWRGGGDEPRRGV